MPKGIVEECLELYAPWVRWHGGFEVPGHRGKIIWPADVSASYTTLLDGICLSYRISDSQGNTRDHCYAIHVGYSVMPHAARRVWWICPECGRRCVAVYLPIGTERFACRACHKLAYRVQTVYIRKGYRGLLKEWGKHSRLMRRSDGNIKMINELD